MTVLTVIATDADNGNNGSVTYSLKQVPMKGSQPLFSIDSHMGLISTMLNNALDRETQPEYYIIVQAKDRGSPPMLCKQITTSFPEFFFSKSYKIYAAQQSCQTGSFFHRQAFAFMDRLLYCQFFCPATMLFDRLDCYTAKQWITF